MRGWLPVAVALLACGTARAGDTLNLEAAKSHYAAGKDYFEDERWSDALREFREAYRLSRRAALLYNIGLCDEHLARYPDAIVALKEFLLLEPAVPDRPAVEQKIRDLEERVRPREPEPRLPTVAPSPPPPVEPPPQQQPAPSSEAHPRRRVATWAVGGVGLALLAGGAGALVASHLDYQSLIAECGTARNACPPGYASTRDEGRALQWVGGGLLAAGGAAVAASVALYFLEGRRDPRAAFAPLLLPSGAGFAAVARF